MEPSEAWVALRSAELVCPAAAVAQAVVRVAAEITRELEAENPLVLSVMGGAVVFTGQLRPLLRFPLEFE
jgi:hypoxanthine phosphoribosyltransferase